MYGGYIMKRKGRLFFYQQIDSTNLQAKRLAEQGAQDGTVVWALDQRCGRGRLGKKWASAAGRGVYLSFVLRPRVDFADYARITLVAGVAVARFLKKELGESAEKIALKWPNDLLVEGKKIAGILAEAAAPGAGYTPFVIVGIGVNIFHEREDFPTDISSLATSLFLETGKKPQGLQPLVRSLQQHLHNCVADFERGLFPQLLAEWRGMDYLYGKKIECVAVDGRVVTGVALGPDETGVLFLEDSSGCRHEILSGDLRLAIEKPPVKQGQDS